MSVLPIFLKLEGRRVLLAGAGAVALDKIETLLERGARVRVVAPEARMEIREYAREGKLEWVERRFEPADLDGCFLAIAATDSPEVNEAVYRASIERRVLCNSVDDIPHCDFFFGSIVRRGELQIAISTNGESPALAQRMRREINALLPEDLGPWLGRLGELRRQVLEMHPRGETRRLLLHQLAQRPICNSSQCPSRLMAAAGFSRCDENAGKVFLVGAGPGDPELLTVRALRLIQTADAILHDDLVPPSILALAMPRALTMNVGKRCGVKKIGQEEINALMVEHARAGRCVVRLKSGDSLVFGRAAEEMAALAEAGIEYEAIPGITAASAAAAAVGCSLTDRNSASSVIVSTGYRASSRRGEEKSHIENATRAVYMPGRDLAPLAEEWLSEGYPADLPCAVVSHAAQPNQKVYLTTLGALSDAPPAEAPSVLLAGWAVRNIAAEHATAASAVSISA
jgi:uroporphyrin-III C-methyltransferase/precorrin-2 dehydrogenase/sirohydrochlorin ferrochelatase